MANKKQVPDGEGKSKGMTYKDAGVSIDAGEKAVELIREAVKSTYNENVIGDIGGFAGFYNGSFPGMKEPLLVSATDGIGGVPRRAGRADYRRRRRDGHNGRE